MSKKVHVLSKALPVTPEIFCFINVTSFQNSKMLSVQIDQKY